MGRFYYGWWVVTATMTVFTVVMGITYSSYGLFVLPLSHEFGLSRADANSGLIVLNASVALISPFLGRLLDRTSVRRVMICCSVIFAAAYLLIAASASLWMVIGVLALVLPFGVKGAGTLTAPLLVVRWFTARRGRAMMLSQLGLSLGGLVIPPLAGFLIERFGWREAAAVLGVGGGAVLLAIALTTREAPRAGELEAPAGATSAGRDEGGALSFASIVARPAFWTINLSCAVAAGISMALMISLVPYGRQLGLSTIQAAAIISAMSASGIAAKLALAFVADRINRLWLLGLLFLGGGALNAALLEGSSYSFMLVIAVGLGIVNSAVTPLQFAANADRFGAPSFGAVSGLAVPLTAVVGALAVRFAGEVFDRTGSYDLLFQVFAVIQAAAALLVVATRFDMPGARLCWPRRRVSGHR